MCRRGRTPRGPYRLELESPSSSRCHPLGQRTPCARAVPAAMARHGSCLECLTQLPNRHVLDRAKRNVLWCRGRIGVLHALVNRGMAEDPKQNGGRRRFMDGVTAVLVVCAIILTAMSVRRELGADRATSTFPRIAVEANWQQYAREGQAIGTRTAAVTIVEFGDFGCRYCGRFVTYVDSLERLGLPVRVIYRHFPSKRPTAIPGIRASECAARQGRFEAMHHALYAHLDSIGVAAWSWFGALAGVPDLKQLETCVQQTNPILSLAADTLAAKELDVHGTPTLLIHAVRSNGLPPFDSLRAYVERAYARTIR